MDKIKMSEDIDQHRRNFLGTAAMTAAATQLGMTGSAAARSSKTVKPGAHTSFGPLKQIDAGLLNVGYAEAGPADGAAVISCTAGPTTFIAMSMSPRCWRRRGTA
jgi:hypothetical protein